MDQDNADGRVAGSVYSLSSEKLQEIVRLVQERAPKVPAGAIIAALLNRPAARGEAPRAWLVISQRLLQEYLDRVPASDLANRLVSEWVFEQRLAQELADAKKGIKRAHEEDQHSTDYYLKRTPLVLQACPECGEMVVAGAWCAGCGARIGLFDLPTTVDEAVDAILATLSQTERDRLRDIPDEWTATAVMHGAIGLYIRNHWIYGGLGFEVEPFWLLYDPEGQKRAREMDDALQGDPEVRGAARLFRARIWHADDESSVVTAALWRRVRQETGLSCPLYPEEPLSPLGRLRAWLRTAGQRRRGGSNA